MIGRPWRRLRATPETLAARVGDEIVLVHTGTDRIYVLNRTGARVWELLCEDCDPPEIERRLLEEFEATPGEVAQHVEELMASLAKGCLIAAAADE